MKIELVATATFGLEAVVRREIEALGYKVLKTEDGKVTYLGDEKSIVRSNLWLRTADRVYVRMGEFTATTFEELFQQVKAIPWENYISPDGRFPVVGTSVKSELHSVPACQSIIKKAVASRLGEFYFERVMPETGAEYRIRFSALKNKFTIMIDTSGAGLHKRGYRIKDVAAPIKETLAAAIVQLSFYRPDKILVDTCCGSGTIPIEAAMIARNIAPGLGRTFSSTDWDIIPANIWKEEKKLAYEAGDFESELRIKAMDIDSNAIKAAKANADEAGLLDDIEFVCMDMMKWKPEGEYGVIITNPPYGERIGEKKDIERIYTKLGKVLTEHPTWSMFMITTDKEIEEKFFGRKADRRRKLYNGRLETQLYQYHGTKPKREKKDE
ncbi:MAG: class I SAM-dependent RNA methyltransferase [Clostridiales bacterium]|nr:class I SAM-dependent RNA methyltransferase [Clostridiales bacterium]